MVCTVNDTPTSNAPWGAVEDLVAPAIDGCGMAPSRPGLGDFSICPALETAGGDDPFDDFEDDDFDDEFDDDFEEDWEDDLTEDDEFPDTFGGQDEGEEPSGTEDSPFSDDPDFDED